ncbi:MAG: GIY-YIG nuclease family protein [bacterium]|nr:GIY-YIG nuclease family protein [bacterium]
MYYVYVLKINRRGIYIGYTEDLKRRFKEHSKSSKCVLVYYEAYESSDLARNRERKLKQYSGALRALKKRINI